jgi:hypothetical protein
MSHKGIVSFHELSPNLTRVMVDMEFEPNGVMEKMASGLRFVKRAVESDLARFKSFVEMQDAEGIEYRPSQQDEEDEQNGEEDEQAQGKGEDDAGEDENSADEDEDDEEADADEPVSREDKSEEEREQERKERQQRRRERQKATSR